MRSSNSIYWKIHLEKQGKFFVGFPRRIDFYSFIQGVWVLFPRSWFCAFSFSKLLEYLQLWWMCEQRNALWTYFKQVLRRERPTIRSLSARVKGKKADFIQQTYSVGIWFQLILIYLIILLTYLGLLAELDSNVSYLQKCTSTYMSNTHWVYLHMYKGVL